MRRMMLVVAALACFQVQAAEHGGHEAADKACDRPTLACAKAVTPWVAADGTLWLAWSAGGVVSVAAATPDGALRTKPVVVSGGPALVDDNGEARPKVFADGKGLVLATWTVRAEKGFTGRVFVARSQDGGQSFSPPAALTPDTVSQRFETVVPLADGRLLGLWIDKRVAASAKRDGRAYAGAALAGAVSSDGGQSFSGETILSDNSCECCRLATASLPDGGAAVIWRHIYDGGVRDHAAARVDGGAVTMLSRVAVDDWPVQACPHHGPALAVDDMGRWHVAWYTKGNNRKGLFLARSDDGGRSWGAPAAIGNPAQGPGHPALMAVGRTLWLAWKEFDGESASIKVQHSTDGGGTWSEAVAAARTWNASDHPQLVALDGKAKLSWATRDEGWRLFDLEAH